MSDSAFLFVWNPAGRAPQHQHASKHGAISEAERLARNNPGETFIVLESVCARTVDGMQRIDLSPEQEYPF